MKLGMEIGLDPGHIVLDGDGHLPLKRGTTPFLAHFCCGHMAGWIKMPFGTQIGLDPDNIVRWGPSFPHDMGTAAPPHFSAHVYCGQTVAHLSIC